VESKVLEHDGAIGSTSLIPLSLSFLFGTQAQSQKQIIEKIECNGQRISLGGRISHMRLLLSSFVTD